MVINFQYRKRIIFSACAPSQVTAIRYGLTTTLAFEILYAGGDYRRYYQALTRCKQIVTLHPISDWEMGCTSEGSSMLRGHMGEGWV